MDKSPSFVNEHPWLTFFLGIAVVHGAVAIVRGYPAPPRLTPLALGRGTYRP